MSLFRRKPKLTGVVFDMAERQHWGNNIWWDDFAEGKVTGLTTPSPRVGDELRTPMESGRVARLYFKEVNRRHDPPDMWSGVVAGIGYLDEDPDAPEVTRFGVFGERL